MFTARTALPVTAQFDPMEMCLLVDCIINDVQCETTCDKCM